MKPYSTSRRHSPEVIFWLLLTGLILSLGECLPKLPAETVKEMQENMNWVKPVSLLNIDKWWCQVLYGIDTKTKEIVRWKIDGIVVFKDGEEWVDTIRIYNQSRKPIELIDKNCTAWATFILQEYRKEKAEKRYIIHADALRRERK